MPQAIPIEHGSGVSDASANPAWAASHATLKALAKRLARLRAVWAVLAPSASPDGTKDVLHAELAGKQQVLRLARLSGGIRSNDLSRLADALDTFAAVLCRVAFEAPISRLHATLPRRPTRDLKSLLDLIAEDAFEALETQPGKLRVVDYLITLLCTENAPQTRVAPLDPVELTPTFKGLCERAEAECVLDLAQIEAEFFTGANLAADLQGQDPLRELGARKAELGRSYFAPGMLRAIVTYNLALLQSQAPEAWDVGPVAGTPSIGQGAESSEGSVFDSKPLHELLAAVRQRLDRAIPSTDPIQRIAWALDLDDLTAAEMSVLREGRFERDDLGTAILLVGLLCRSREVLAIELQKVGIDPDRVAVRWLEELDQLVKLEVNESITDSASETLAYQRACGLSSLRNKYLYPSGEIPRRPPSRHTVAGSTLEAEAEGRRVRREAKTLAHEALAGKSAARPSRPRGEDAGSWAWERVAAVALALVLGLSVYVVQYSGINLPWSDVDRFAPNQLEAISPYLVKGHRNGDGAGIAFVGRVGEKWQALGRAQRERAAESLVAKLREQGVLQVMIYDAQDRLRVQALGEVIRTP